MVRRRGRRRLLGGARTVTVVVVLAGAMAIAGGPALRGREETTVRGVHDITTDLVNPPPFVDVLRHRRWALNPPGYDGPEAASLQRRLHPDVAPLDVGMAPAAVHAAARALVDDRGWTLVADVPADGRLEAIAVTPWLRFRDDVVVRVTATPGGSRVDMRSKSRFGRSDFGTNARRVRAFLADLEARLVRASARP